MDITILTGKTASLESEKLMPLPKQDNEHRRDYLGICLLFSVLRWAFYLFLPDRRLLFGSLPYRSIYIQAYNKHEQTFFSPPCR